MEHPGIVTRFALVVVILSVSVSCGTGQQSPKSAAEQKLASFVKNIKKENAKSYGLESVSQGEELKVGDEVNVFTIRLDELMNAGRDISNLVKASKRKLFIIKQGETNVYGSMELELSKDKWDLRSIGESSSVKSYVNANRGKIKRDYTLITIPALGHTFSGYKTDNDWMVTIVGDEKIGDYSAGQEVLLSKLIPSLQEEGRRYNGLPR